MYETLDTHKSTTFFPSHVTTDYNPTTAHPTGIYIILRLQRANKWFKLNTTLFPQHDNDYPTIPSNL